MIFNLITFRLGCMGLIILIARPMPSMREYVRAEAYLGRYVQANLFAICWCERMLQVEKDQTNRILDWILRTFFYDPLYHSAEKSPELYR